MRLKLQSPVSPYYLNQRFGDSMACIEDTQAPITKRKVVTKVNGTCPVGYVDLYSLLGMKGHTGADLHAYHGQPVFASHDGVVEEVQTELERGLGIGIITNEPVDMDTFGTHLAKTRYWHLISIEVQKGQHVQQGQVIGLADNTGLSSGNHVHWEIKPVEKNPDGTYFNVYQSNGFYGAIDPILFIDESLSKWTFNYNMAFGEESEEVRQMQIKIQALGYFPAQQKCTGFYGRVSSEAVRKFLKSNGITANGRNAGPKTRKLLNKLLA